MTESRSAGVTYTNTTGKPIKVVVIYAADSQICALTIDGIVVSRQYEQSAISVSLFYTTSEIVPNGSTYLFSGIAPTGLNELR